MTNSFLCTGRTDKSEHHDENIENAFLIAYSVNKIVHLGRQQCPICIVES